MPEVNLENAEKDFAKHEAEIRKIDDPQLKQANVRGTRTVEEALKLEEIAKTWMEQMALVFRAPPTEFTAQLGNRAMTTSRQRSV